MHFCISERQESVAAACQVPHARIAEVIVKDALEIINDAPHKLHLYQGRRVCDTNQQVHLEKIIFGENYQRHRKKCPENKKSSEALVVSDWKMKFEAMSSRETTQQHFENEELVGMGVYAYNSSMKNSQSIKMELQVPRVVCKISNLL